MGGKLDIGQDGHQIDEANGIAYMAVPVRVRNEGRFVDRWAVLVIEPHDEGHPTPAVSVEFIHETAQEAENYINAAMETAENA